MDPRPQCKDHTYYSFFSLAKYGLTLKLHIEILTYCFEAHSHLDVLTLSDTVQQLRIKWVLRICISYIHQKCVCTGVLWSTFYIKGRGGLNQCLVLACANVAAANMSAEDNTITIRDKEKAGPLWHWMKTKEDDKLILKRC